MNHISGLRVQNESTFAFLSFIFFSWLCSLSLFILPPFFFISFPIELFTHLKFLWLCQTYDSDFFSHSKFYARTREKSLTKQFFYGSWRVTFSGAQKKKSIWFSERVKRKIQKRKWNFLIECIPIKSLRVRSIWEFETMRDRNTLKKILSTHKRKENLRKGENGERTRYKETKERERKQTMMADKIKKKKKYDRSSGKVEGRFHLEFKRIHSFGFRSENGKFRIFLGPHHRHFLFRFR